VSNLLLLSPYSRLKAVTTHSNNFYIFPGLGLGAVLAKVSHVTEKMVEASALGLANALEPDERASDLIYPQLVRIREISARVAHAVIRAAQRDKVDRNVDLRTMSDAQLLQWIEKKAWSPAAL
jgi:malate dehydrogenase (oxaloacetate-decarboxylating)(NADP+)